MPEREYPPFSGQLETLPGSNKEESLKTLKGLEGKILKVEPLYSPFNDVHTREDAIQFYQDAKSSFDELRQKYDINVPEIELVVGKDEVGQESMFMVIDEIRGENLMSVDKLSRELLPQLDDFYNRLLQFTLDAYQNHKPYYADVNVDKFIIGRSLHDKNAKIYLSELDPENFVSSSFVEFYNGALPFVIANLSNCLSYIEQRLPHGSMLQNARNKLEEIQAIIKNEHPSGALPPRKDDDNFHNAMRQVNLGGLESRLNLGFRLDANLPDMARLVFELKDTIQEYDVILGDDASGRLPALLISRLAKLERVRSNLPPIETIFIIAGSLGNIKANRKRFLEIKNLLQSRAKKSPIKKALFVTDTIMSGFSVQLLLHICNTLNIHCDVAALTIQRGRGYPFSDKLYFGGYGLPALYKENDLGGVVSSRDLTSAHATIFQSNDRQMDRTIVTKTRQDLRMIAEELSHLLD